MRAICSFMFNLTFYVWTFLLSSLAIPGLLFPASFMLKVAYIWGLGTHALLRFFIGTTYEIRSQENLPQGPYIVASKHQSALETTMIQVLAFGSTIILKKELMWIPIFGQALYKAGVISIDRSQGKKVIPQLIEKSKKFIQKGRPIFIYPEGTRSEPGKKPKYKAGVFALYEALKIPVVPIAHNTGYFWGRRDFIKKKGHVVYEILKPIEPGLSEADFMKKLENDIESACKRLKPHGIS